MSDLDIVSAEIVDITERQYHAETGLGASQWVTRSMLCSWIESPHGFALRHVHKDPLAQHPGASSSMRLGSAFDVLITEGSTAYSRAYPVPVPVPAPAAWLTPSGAVSKSADVQAQIAQCCTSGCVVAGVRATLDAWLALCDDGAVVLTATEQDTVDYMAATLRENPLARTIIDGASGSQTTIRAVLANGLRLQVRADLWCERLGILADLKTTRKRRGGFLSAAVEYGYHVQDWLYSAMAEAVGLQLRHPFLFVCQQNCYPWESYVVQLDDEVRSWAGRLTAAAIAGISAGYYGDRQTAAYVPPRPMWLELQMDLDQGE